MEYSITIHFFQLAKEEAPNAQLTGNQKYAVVYTDKKYKPAFKEDFADAWLVNVKTGAEKLAFEKTCHGFNTFPAHITRWKVACLF